jgi:hypothetical protein
LVLSTSAIKSQSGTFYYSSEYGSVSGSYSIIGGNVYSNATVHTHGYGSSYYSSSYGSSYTGNSSTAETSLTITIRNDGKETQEFSFYGIFYTVYKKSLISKGAPVDKEYQITIPYSGTELDVDKLRILSN